MNPRDGDLDRPCIALIGYRGCGKTAVGRELATLLGGEHVDTDERIVEQAGTRWDYVMSRPAGTAGNPD